MCPEVRSAKPAACPRCGMALEPEMPVAATRVEYTCPMHPEIVRPGPGSCPICGMALEPRIVTAQEQDNPELRDMTRRFWISVALTVPLLVIAMGHMLPGMPRLLPEVWQPWIELLLATPVVLWGGAPFFERGWTSIANRSTNMFTLIAMGQAWLICSAWWRPFFRKYFPLRSSRWGKASGVFRSGGGDHDVGVAGAGARIARCSRTGAAIRALLDLSPKMARVLREGARKISCWSRCDAG
jgi:Cu+-exporting ATPase